MYMVYGVGLYRVPPFWRVGFLPAIFSRNEKTLGLCRSDGILQQKNSATWICDDKMSLKVYLGVEPKIGGFYPQNGWWK